MRLLWIKILTMWISVTFPDDFFIGYQYFPCSVLLKDNRELVPVPTSSADENGDCQFGTQVC